MSKSFRCCFNIKSFVLFAFVFFVILNYCNGLSCLKCDADRPDSECTLGKRMYKPRLQVCFGRKAQCYAIAKLDESGDALFQRGCTIRDICSEEGVEYCKVCKSQFCNYDVMDIEVEYVESN